MGQHLLSNSEDLEAIFLRFETPLCLFDLLILLSDELLLGNYILLNFVIQQVEGLLLVLTDVLELLEEPFDGIWWHHFDIAFSALFLDISELALGFFQFANVISEAKIDRGLVCI